MPVTTTSTASAGAVCTRCSDERNGEGLRRAAPQVLLMRNRLPVLRAERGWTQADLAERLDVSRQTIVSIEKGKYDPSLPLAFRIAELFALSIEEIFDPDGEEARSA